MKSIKKIIKKYRTIAQIEEEYLLNHLNEIGDYLKILREEIQEQRTFRSRISSFFSRIKAKLFAS